MSRRSKIALALLLMSGSTAHACEALRESGMSFSQVVTMKKAFIYGKEHDLSYSLSAIAWKESMAGKYKINLQDPSAGVFHISIKNALVYLEVGDTGFNRNRVAQMLINDFTLSAEYAIITLKFWQEQHNNDWSKVWASYNAGYNVKAGKSYAEDIARKIIIIKTCGWG